MLVRADLHIHTVLSPCAEVEMIPPLIVERALEAGLDLIAITDHNASANAGAVMSAAQSAGLKVLPGMELQTREEVHLLCLFDTLEQLATFQTDVSRALPDLRNRAETLGEQFVVDAAGDFVRREERLLLVAAKIALADAVARVNALGGIAVPAHIDRPANGLIALLGFVPADLPVAALEISRNISAATARARFRLPNDVALIRGSDAHWLDAVGTGATEFEMKARSVGSLLRALRENRFSIFDCPLGKSEIESRQSKIRNGIGVDMRSSDLRAVPMAAALLPAEDDPLMVAEQRAKIDAIIAEHAPKAGSTMLILNQIQAEVGHVSKAMQNHIAEKLRVPLKDVYGVITFYSFFTMKPRGKHRVAFCLGTACYVSGAEMLIEKAQQILGVKLGDTTPDKKFTIEPCRCLGACSQAPAVLVDDNVHGRNTPDRIVTVLRKYEKIG